MSAKSFEKACLSHRLNARKPWAYKYTRNIYEDFCKECGGECPPELELIE